MGARILIVEDNLANMELMVYLLSAFGHQPLQAHDGEQGVALARSALPDLIICDLQLPKLDGYGVMQQLKGDAATRAIPILAASALVVTDGGAALRAAGFDGNLAKSFDPQEMLPALDALLPAALRSAPTQQAGDDSGENDINNINDINQTGGHAGSGAAADADAGAADHDAGPAVAAALSGDGAPPALAVTKGARILLLDAAPDDCGLVASVLLHFGYALTVASDAEQAAQARGAAAYDLLLCDLDPLHALRSGFPGAALHAHPGLPLIVLRPDRADDVGALLGAAATAARLLEHPIEPWQLIEAIERALADAKRAA